MKNAILSALLIMVLVFVASCKHESTEPVVVPDFELNGVWYGTDSNPPWGDVPIDFSYTFTNTGFDLTYDGEPMSGSIKSYDNTANTMVFLWTTHPAFQGMFQKFTWVENRLSAITVQPYAEQETQAAATSSSDIGEYEPVEMVKANTATCAIPTFSPGAGAIAIGQSVAISSATPNATIRYTNDGTEPTESSPIYSLPLTLSTATTLKAKAFKTGYLSSEIATASYTMLLSWLMTDALPSTDNPNGTWSFGRKWSATGSSFDLLTVYGEDTGWWFGNWGHGAPAIRSGLNVWAKDNSNGLPAIRWTCPTTGIYNIQPTFKGIDGRGVDVLVFVVHNDTVIFQGSIQAYLQEVGNSIEDLTIVQGDNLDFVVKWNGGVYSEYNWTQVSAIITN